MSQAGWSALEGQVGASPPATLRALHDDDLRELASAIADARHRQAAELAAAGDAALSHIPRVLRVPLRKVIG